MTLRAGAMPRATHMELAKRPVTGKGKASDIHHQTAQAMTPAKRRASGLKGAEDKAAWSANPRSGPAPSLSALRLTAPGAS